MEGNMICKNCGKRIDENDKFCGGCGAPVQDVKETVLLTEKEEAVHVDKDKKKISTVLKALVACFILIGLVCIGKYIASPEKIDMSKYVVLNTSGYEGSGHASLSIDWDLFEENYGSSIQYTKKTKAEYPDVESICTSVDSLKGTIMIYPTSATNGLSNGDKVDYEIEYDQDILDHLNVKLKNLKGSVKVKDLDEIETFDAFKNLTVTFTGLSGEGKVELSYEGECLNQYSFTTDAPYDLSNGDTVTITIPDYDIEQCLKTYGKIPAETEKKYTVNSLTHYINDRSQVTEEVLQVLKDEADQWFDDFKEHSLTDEADTFQDKTYVGYVLASVEESYFFSRSPGVYIVYKVDVRNAAPEDGYDQINSYYWCAGFAGVEQDPENNVILDNTVMVSPIGLAQFFSNQANTSMSAKHSWSYNGFNTVDEMIDFIKDGWAPVEIYSNIK